MWDLPASGVEPVSPALAEGFFTTEPPGTPLTGIFKMDHQQGPAAERIELCPALCGSLDGRGVWGRMDACTCMVESLFRSPEMITALFVNQLYPNTKLKR